MTSQASAAAKKVEPVEKVMTKKDKEKAQMQSKLFAGVGDSTQKDDSDDDSSDESPVKVKSASPTAQ